MNQLTEALEGRVLFHTVAPFGINPNGSLVVDGTDNDDVISVISTRDAIVVSVNALQGKFNASTVKRVLVYGEAGDDRIGCVATAKTPVVVHGGYDKDRIDGSGPNVSLFGDAGNDTLLAKGDFGVTLHGNNGNDRLFGGIGVDRFYGGRGNDYASPVHLGDFSDGIETMFALAHGMGDPQDVGL
jgi:Ca2+-binding RTX toxin-like protein